MYCLPYAAAPKCTTLITMLTDGLLQINFIDPFPYTLNVFLTCMTDLFDCASVSMIFSFVVFPLTISVLSYKLSSFSLHLCYQTPRSASDFDVGV